MKENKYLLDIILILLVSFKNIFKLQSIYFIHPLISQYDIIYDLNKNL